MERLVCMLVPNPNTVFVHGYSFGNRREAGLSKETWG